MKCKQCGSHIKLHHKPGYFLIAFFTLLLVAYLGFVLDIDVFILIGCIASIFTLGGISTEITDASSAVYAKHRRNGVFCPNCDTINRIYPWSL